MIPELPRWTWPDRSLAMPLVERIRHSSSRFERIRGIEQAFI